MQMCVHLLRSLLSFLRGSKELMLCLRYLSNTFLPRGICTRVAIIMAYFLTLTIPPLFSALFSVGMDLKTKTGCVLLHTSMHERKGMHMIGSET